jgi:hypothetical protein
MLMTMAIADIVKLAPRRTGLQPVGGSPVFFVQMRRKS